jgi:hypothetical protein
MKLVTRSRLVFTIRLAGSGAESYGKNVRKAGEYHENSTSVKLTLIL